MSYLNWPVSQIATKIPGATAVLFQHKISFCCDGNKLLEQVLTTKELDKDNFVEILADLDNRNKNQVDWQQLNNEDLISHLLTRYHAVHRQQLSELIRLAKRVEMVHGEHQLCPKGLAKHLEAMQAELESHMHKEEMILFPMLLQNRYSMSMGPIQVMRSEHQNHIAEINTIYQLTHDITPPADACNTWQALYLGLQEFISDFNMHIHLENDVLFERACS